MMANEKGFTLIELIMVIVILGILAAVAVPKYQNLQSEAQEAAADGVYAAAEGATSINFATRLVSPSLATAISNGSTLMGAMDGTPDGWSASGATITNTTYTITVSTAENTSAKAKLTRSW